MGTARFRPDGFEISFRRFAAFTTSLTLLLVMLGVYTAATGSGLACSAQWPLCDNGLLPQTVPSFIEWFHRLVAMITGFFILGTAVWSWRADLPRRGRLFATLAAVLLPLQVSIGAVTVTLNGLLPSGYSTPTQAAHLVVALTIFTSLVVATLVAYKSHLHRRPLRRARTALVGALATLPITALFSRVDGLLPYDPAAQAAFVGVSLSTFAALAAAMSWLGRAGARRARTLAAAALVAVFVALLLGRDLVFYTSAVRAVNAGAFGLAAALVGGALWLVRRRAADGSSIHGVSGD